MEQNKTLTLGSLFDGSGGFPLGGLFAGITPVWASEIEPFPIRVTTKRLPFMKHYGDISVMDGSKIEPVDIITFGSPCQDMSVAGKRAGLDGSRSNLFYEAVRIIKEMRKATGGEYPKWACWENVPGAFSSSSGEDFRCVLECLCGIVDESVSIPKPAKWANSGEIVGDGYSVAWRVLDAQYWGVPQRRKRIFLVADLAGGRAGKVLFESEGLSGYTPQGFRPWQGAAESSEACAGTSGIGFDGYNGSVTDDKSATLGVNCGMSTGRNGVVLNDQGGNRMDVTEDVTCTLRAEAHHPPCVMESAGFCTEHSAKARGIGYEVETSPTLRAGTVPAAVALENHPTDSRVKISEDGKVQTLTSRMGTGGMNVPLLLKIRSGCEGGGKGPLIQEDKSATQSCNNDQTLFAPCSWDGGQVSPTLTKENADGRQRMPDKDNFNCVLHPFGICSKDSNAMKSSNPHSGFYKAVTSRTLDGNGGNPSCNQGGIAVVCVDQGGGKSSVNISEELSPTLATSHGGEPVVAIEGNGSRPSHRGDGYSEDNVSYTLNSVEQHGVAYGLDRAAFNQGRNALYDFTVTEEVEPTMVAKGPCAVAAPTYSSSKASFFTETAEETANTLVATDYKDPPLVNDSDGMEYIVRRLTPTECARLQGFPDWWCSDLGTEHPSDAEIYEWYKIFETYRRITGTSGKPKSDKQIRKFLKDPHSDSAEYKMWGNGVALPCVYFVLSGIAWAAQFSTE